MYVKLIAKLVSDPRCVVIGTHTVAEVELRRTRAAQSGECANQHQSLFWGYANARSRESNYADHQDSFLFR